MELLRRLREREAAGRPIRIGLVGCGQMGSGMIHITRAAPGMETMAIADLDPGRAVRELRSLGIPDDSIVETGNRSAVEDALRKGKYAVTGDPLLLCGAEGLDAVVEATGDTETGALVAWNCILGGTDIVMLNVETDVTVGYFLDKMARKAGRVYTVAAGDEPAVCKMLADFSRSMGFEVVSLGKGKNNVLDLSATPDSCRDEALRRGMNPHMLSAFKDGTKTMVEMAAVSNATGLVPDVPGMHGPKVELPDLAKVFIPKEEGGILGRRGCVDYSTGKIAPGVFAIVATDDPRTVVGMGFVQMGPGPYYTFLRPFHLCNIETPLAVAEAVLYRERTVVAESLVSEVVAVAKRDLRSGEKVGGIGSADIFGRIRIHAESSREHAIPMGIAPGGRVIRDIPKGTELTTGNFSPDTSRFVYKLRAMQDEMANPDPGAGAR